MATDDMKARIATFDENLLTRLDDENFQIALPNHTLYLQDKDSETAQSDSSNTPPDADYGDMNLEDKLDADDVEFDCFDQYLGAEFLINSNGETKMATVSKRVKDNEGNAVGKRNANPLLDTREYECTLDDGSVYRYHAKVIADNIYSQCDDEGRRHAVLQEIIEHKKDRTAIEIADGYTTTRRGRRIPKNTTKGWKLLCQWRDGQADWVNLKHLKDYNPVQVAEYAVANRIHEEPAFKWWVPDTLRIRNRIIAKVKSRYWKTSHKYGVKLPHSVQEALQIDKETGTDFWWKAIQKEMKKVMIAFEFDEGMTPEQVRQDKTAYVAFQEIACQMIFDVKMDPIRKARFVAGGHMMEALAGITYSSVVSSDHLPMS